MKRLKFIIANSEVDEKAVATFGSFFNLARQIATDSAPILVKAVQLKDLQLNEKFLYKDEEYRVVRREYNKAFVRSPSGIEMQMSDYEPVEKIMLEEADEEED